MMRDAEEDTFLFEPLLISEGPHREHLNDLALELATRNAGFRHSLPAPVVRALAGLVRSMNCYYSNLIEGHNTHPVDIERALEDDYSADPEKRDLQLEAKAHIKVQQWIDDGGLEAPATDPEMIRAIHRRFCEQLPEELLVVKNPKTGETAKVVPGQFRERDVEVGKHLAISPARVPRFLSKMHETYSRPGKISAILSASCAHHRMLWVHPFLDGNGRVARLMSYAMLRETLDTQGLWSVARGLARSESDYKKHLQACDQPRQGDRDGRGALSEKALIDFAHYFLSTCLDQIAFMEQLMRPDELQNRIMIWAQEKIRGGTLAPKSDVVLRAILHQGEVARGEVADLVGVSERTARRITSELIKTGALHSQSSRAPLTIAFPASLAGRWMPGLFPEQ
ncbi:Fic family protein [Pseudohongiella nitratireducens]|uniref:Fic family protein n=1 Tax=Pseudohongiella nitratireducens TaxID=1768907 RepID=UPI0030EE0559|tara:strand:- start:4272 stop:5459 length:1188 start_codon:yes stop_codon:yes gene_type:complete